MKIDTLIRNGTVLTMDNNRTCIDRGCVAIKDGIIIRVGDEKACADLVPTSVIDAAGGIIMPGFINTHCHAAMTLFRGLADDVNLDQFLQTVWGAEAAYINPSTVELGAMLGVAEMASGGITHFVDMYWHPDATISAAKYFGIGITSGVAMIGTDGLDGLPWDDRITFTRDFLKRYENDDSVHTMLMPHGCYTLDAEKLAQIAGLAKETGCAVHIHAAEAQWEMGLVKTAYNTTPIGALQAAGLLDQPLLIAHAVHLDDGDIELLQRAGSAVSHCPVSNAKLASGTARIRDLLDRGIHVSLGTDGPASGNDLDMFQTMRLASFVHNLKTGKSDTLLAREIVAMATIGGASAAGLANRTGSLEAGKQADVIVVDVQAPHMVPSYDPYSSLVYSAGRSDVRHVLARGAVVVTEGTLTSPIDDVIARVRKQAEMIQPRGNPNPS